ncbi:Late embryogenesis abundant protein LEA-2 subgroup domain-containing protein [Dioscorea alata]|uniref:Late embryogenesis abundant protein LEA-2 subgroup domain-containing protein n=1 Tax=Dioscorea alata TaxID=55571 RepID=A0ACB7US34_DIOAL|nr:Late embryogenesis abundant protein LEA-2 subgroup domain-containing protein [Dioscorea alata]
MSEKSCGHHGHHKHRKLYRRIFFTIIFFIILILLAILIIWLVLRPSRPHFSLQDSSIIQLNFSSNTNYLTSTLQVTLYSHNPNDRIGIYYDRLDTFITYKGQQITLATALPNGYQGHHDVSIWSPYLYGTDVPLAPFLMVALEQDENAGFLLLYVHVDGKLRWKVGSWMSGEYHITVSCPAFFTFDGLKSSFRFHQPTSCTVDI